MEKFRVIILENRTLEIATDKWLKAKENYRQLIDLYKKCNNFYDMYVDGERFSRASFSCKFDINFEYILDVKSICLKKVKREIF